MSYVYSLFRVFGVYLLAEAAIYEFSKDKMARQLVTQYPHLVDEVTLLSTLRALNSNFFTGGQAGISTTDGRLSHLTLQTHALGSLAGIALSSKLIPYREAVEEFSAYSAHSKSALNYRLRMWFLLLVYDGLNLYCLSSGRPTLTDFSEASLLKVRSGRAPEAVWAATAETISYLHRYPLKYFLAENSKIPASRAGAVLRDLCAAVERSG